MRELTLNEVEEVSGGSALADFIILRDPDPFYTREPESSVEISSAPPITLVGPVGEPFVP